MFTDSGHCVFLANLLVYFIEPLFLFLCTIFKASDGGYIFHFKSSADNQRCFSHNFCQGAGLLNLSMILPSELTKETSKQQL